MSQDLQTIDTGITTGVALRDPEKILDEAKARCTALTRMIEETQIFMTIGKKKHLFVEAWITLAQFYGCSGRIVRVEDVDIGGVMGFKAYAEVVHDQTGTRVSSAESICMRDEDNWSTRPRYEWQDGKKVKVGDDPVPLHQVMSMAQTRALSKALAAKFRWVVVLGGWSATPAEEMVGNEHGDAPQPRDTAQQQKQSPRSKAPMLRFGDHKGKQIDDPSIPITELQYLLNYISKNVGSEKRKRYEADDRQMIHALTDEIKQRDQATQGTSVPEDADWQTYCATMFKEYEDQYIQASLYFKVADPIELPYEQRARFQAHLRGLTIK